MIGKAIAVSPSAAIYGTFFLDDVEYALPADAMHEVVSTPERIVALPLAPEFVVGVFNLRGKIVPVVDLKRLLNVPNNSAQVSRRVAIIELDGASLGLLIDATGEVCRAAPEQIAAFEYPAGSTYRVIAGTLRLDHGKRLVCILDAAALLKIENVPQMAAHLAAEKARAALLRRASQRRQCVAFRSGSHRLAFEISVVREIVRVPPMMQVPTLSHPHCIGMLRLREESVPVLDFADFLGIRASSASASSSQESDGSFEGDEQRIIVAVVGGGNIGWRVDAIETIVSYFADDVLPIPLLTDTRAAMFSGCITSEKAGTSASEVILLDHAAIFSHDELNAFARSHRNLHATSPANDRGGARQRGRREQYLAFRLDQRFATPLNTVREIIEMPADSTPAPGGPQFVTGILNLRQQMIPLIDLRSLYGITSWASDNRARPESTRKVLIVEHGTRRYGLIVDAIETIFSADEHDRIRVPSIMLGDINAGFNADARADLREAVELRGESSPANAKSQTVLILSLARTAERIDVVLAA